MFHRCNTYIDLPPFPPNIHKPGWPGYFLNWQKHPHDVTNGNVSPMSILSLCSPSLGRGLAPTHLDQHIRVILTRNCLSVHGFPERFSLQFPCRWTRGQSVLEREGGGVNQTYSWLSTTHGHITDRKLDSAVYAGLCMWVNVDLSCLGWTIYARQFLGAKPPIQFRHRWAERKHSDHLYRLQAAQSVA